MGALGIVSILVGLTALKVAFPRPTERDAILFVLIYAVHLAATFSYWQYVQVYGGDATFYYENPLGLTASATDTGTPFVVWLVQLLREIVGGSFLDYFLLFQLFGIFAIALILRMTCEVAVIFSAPRSLGFQYVLLAPGLHFWTVAIGKDGPVNLGVALAIWSVFSLKKRVLTFLIAVVIMYFFRPHIAVLTLAVVPLCLVFEDKVSIGSKLVLSVLAVVLLSIGLPTVLESLNIQVFDSDNVEEFLARKYEYGLSSEDSAALVTLPLPLKILSLLFRPFFFDAGGVVGLIASIENFGLLVVFLFLIWNFRGLGAAAAQSLFVRFSLAYSCLLILALSLVNYNVGLGLRQKMMVMPAILVLFFVALAMGAIRKRQRRMALMGSAP